MILVVDMGNTTITFGVFDNQVLTHKFQVLTDSKKSFDEYHSSIETILKAKKLEKSMFTGAIISSVVPPLNNVLIKLISTIFGVPPLLLGAGVKTGLAIHIDEPSTLGSDLAAVSVGALTKYGSPAIIVDLGTATKIVALDQKGAFIGGVFTPGLLISVNALVGSTAQLPEISLNRPKKVIGRNTQDSMNSGATYGTASMIKGVISDFVKELGYDSKVILTGGYSHLIKDLLPDYLYDEDLILYGLLFIYRKNERQSI
jgi:type III pantothenate kinase